MRWMCLFAATQMEKYDFMAGMIADNSWFFRTLVFFILTRGICHADISEMGFLTAFFRIES